MNFLVEDFERYDARLLFPDIVHTNKLIKIDNLDLSQSDTSDAKQSNKSSHPEEPPKAGDSISEVNKDCHFDQLYEMEGTPADRSSSPEVNADKTEDLRTKEPEAQQPTESSEPEPTEKTEPSETSEKENETSDSPLQKEKENIDEVCEASSKTSEDIHGGDEATKDIKDSPNAADNGENSDNSGAEEGENSKNSESESSESEDPQSNDSNPDESGNSGGSNDSGDSVGDLDDDPFAAEHSESLSARSVSQQLVSAARSEFRPKSASGGGKSVDYAQGIAETAGPGKIFSSVRELIRKLVNEEDFSQKVQGTSRWNSKQIAKRIMSCQHTSIAQSKYDRPKNNKLVFFVDISGSVSHLAEIFMALMGGVAGLPGVHIVVGSEAHAEYEIVVDRPFKSVDKAITFFRETLNHDGGSHSGGASHRRAKAPWSRPYERAFEPGIKQFLKDKSLWAPETTCVFFGDMQAVYFSEDLKEIVNKVRCLWLFTDEPGHYTHTGDLPIAIEAGLPIVYNIRSADSFAWAVRRLNGARKIVKGFSLVAPLRRRACR